MSLRLAWSASLSGHRFDATVGAVKSFGAVCREVRTEAGLTQKEVAQAGDLEQSRVSEIERGRYTPGLDLAVRLAKGLGVPLTELVARWEGLKAEVILAACGGTVCGPVRASRPSTSLRRTCSAASKASGRTCLPNGESSTGSSAVRCSPGSGRKNVTSKWCLRRGRRRSSHAADRPVEISDPLNPSPFASPSA